MSDQASPVAKTPKPSNPTGKPFFATIIVAILSFAMIMSALDIESGKEIVISGRRAGMKRFIVGLAETLGTTGSIIVGALATGLCVIWLVSAIRKRKAMGTMTP